MVKDTFFYSLKGDSLRSIVFDVLCVQWPLSMKDIHKLVKEQGMNVTYQGVRRIVKDLVESKCLVEEDNRYQINLEWVNELKFRIRQIESSYKGEFYLSKNLISKEGKKFNVIIAKDGTLRNTLHEQALLTYLKELIPIYRKEFNPHNIFQKSDEDVLDYLLKIQKEHEFFIPLVDDIVIGGTVLEKKDESLDGKHKVWKLKHFALKENVDDKLCLEIIKETEERLRKTAPSIKIQLNLSETEKKYIRLFKKRGFKEEAVLKDHYRIGEHMHIFAKVIGN